MQDRSLIIGGGTQNVRSRKVTCGVPQGFILGPALWNIFYDDLLRINLPPGTTLIGFADYMALTAVAHTTPLLEDLVNNVLARVNSWIEEHQLSLAPQKSEAILLTRKQAYQEPNFVLAGHAIPVLRSLRYLGVVLDSHLRFTKHIEKVSEGATLAAGALSRIMLRIGGPTQAKRRLLMSVVASRLLYAAPVWAVAGTATAKN